MFWQHVRLAGFGPGSTDPSVPADYLPKNAVGGYIGVTNALGNIPITNMKGTYIVCSDSIAGKFAKQLDLTLDDGIPNTGSVMVTTAATAPVASTAPLNDDTPYLVCMGF
jgi:hypothetical protein